MAIAGSARLGGVRRAALLAPVGAVAVLDPAGLAPFGPAKWAAVSTAVFVAATVALRQPARPDRTAAIAWSAFVAAVTVAAALGVDGLYAWTGTPERHFGWVTWVLCALAFVVGRRLVRDDADRQVLTGGLVALAAVAALSAFAEAAGWWVDGLAGASRPGGITGTPAFLGALLCLALPPCVALSRRRPSVAIVAVAASIALLLTGARAAWFGLAAALVVCASTAHRARETRTKPWLGGVAVVGALVVAALGTGAFGRVADLATDTNGGARGRLDEWRIALKVIAEEPVTGVGPEGYRIAFADAVDTDYERRHGREPLPDRAHSAILDVAATTGALGLAPYLALLAVTATRAVRTIRGGSRVAAGLAFGVLAYLAQSLLLFPLAELDPLLWLVAGSLCHVERRPQAAVPHDKAQGRRAPGPAIPVVSLSLSLALSLAAMVAAIAGVLDVAADRAARQVLDDIAAGASPADPERPARLRPDALRYRLVAARGLRASTEPGAFAANVDQLRTARDLSPRDPVARREEASVLLDRARATLDPVDIEAARAALASLAHDDPYNGEVHLELGVAAALDGDLQSAERAWVTAEELAPSSSAPATNLAIAYARDGRLDAARRAAERALDGT